MALDDARLRLRRQLEETYGMDGATILMDQPPGGWHDLVTNESLRLELAVVRGEIAELRVELRGEIAELRAELRGEMNSMEHRLMATMEREIRAQTWRLMTAMLAGMGTMFIAFAIILKA